MGTRNSKRGAGSTGIKALIATASVAATVAAWAMLPANDPRSAVADQSTQPPAITGQPTPGAGTQQGGASGDFAPPAPDFTSPGLTVPNADTPNTDAPSTDVPLPNWSRPLTRSHSSR